MDDFENSHYRILSETSKVNSGRCLKVGIALVGATCLVLLSSMMVGSFGSGSVSLLTGSDEREVTSIAGLGDEWSKGPATHLIDEGGRRRRRKDKEEEEEEEGGEGKAEGGRRRRRRKDKEDEEEEEDEEEQATSKKEEEASLPKAGSAWQPKFMREDGKVEGGMADLSIKEEEPTMEDLREEVFVPHKAYEQFLTEYETEEKAQQAYMASLGELPLPFIWDIWEQMQLLPNQMRMYSDATHKVAGFSSVWEFWALWHSLPQPSVLLSALHMKRLMKSGEAVNIDALMVFRRDIRPEWEDPVNAIGGHLQWTLGTDLGKEAIDAYWNNMVIGMVGGMIKPPELVTGVRLVDRITGPKASGHIRLELWFTNFTDTDAVNLLRASVANCLSFNRNGEPWEVPIPEVKAHGTVVPSISSRRPKAMSAGKGNQPLGYGSVSYSRGKLPGGGGANTMAGGYRGPGGSDKQY